MGKKLTPEEEAERSKRTAEADAMLKSLLKTPKTRAGLVAAVATKGLSQNYVFGFLSTNVCAGEVVKLREGMTITYQMAEHQSVRVFGKGLYPNWLEPRDLPKHTGRHALIDGVYKEMKDIA